MSEMFENDNSKPSMPQKARRFPLLFLLCGALLAFSACNRGPSPPPAAQAQAGARRYSLKGKIISIDKKAGNANIDNEPIPNFMGEMVMSYTIKAAAALDQLQTGDSITANVVLQADNTYWLENVKVTGHSKTPASPPEDKMNQRKSQ